jgi:Zn-dependent protease with chaperone function
MLNLADNTRVSAQQFPGLHRLTGEIAAALGLQTVPTLFVDTQPEINAMALGGARGGVIVVHTALLEAFDSEEVAVVLGHEMGHLVAQHSFYRQATEGIDVIQGVMQIVPGGAGLGLVLQWLLNDWFRKAELTADRAALVATGDLDAVQRTILKLAGGTRVAGIGTLNLDEFLRQAHEFRDLLRQRLEADSAWDRLEFIASSLMVQNAVRTHPWPALRYLEITEWAATDHYAALAAGDWEEAHRLADTGTATQGAQPPPSEFASQAKAVGKATADLVKERWRNRRL